MATIPGVTFEYEPPPTPPKKLLSDAIVDTNMGKLRLHLLRSIAGAPGSLQVIVVQENGLVPSYRSLTRDRVDALITALKVMREEM